MTYKCVIVDDEELACRLISNHLSKLKQFELVTTCSNAIEASQVLKQHDVDLLFLDIEMPVMKGVDFFKNLVHKPKVIFTTAYRDYALEGFELDAVDFLLKPITFARFFKALEKFENLQSVQESAAQSAPPKDDFIFVRKNRKQIKIHFDAILYIRGMKDYVTIFASNGKHTVKYTLSNILEVLDYRFLRIHRSYIVNSQKISAYTTLDVELDGIEVPIGESYKEHVLKHFE